MHPAPTREAEICGEDGARCRQDAALAWEEVQDAAERWNDRSAACERTTFVAYEWSGFTLGSNLHRNVIFRNEIVPRLPISYLDFTREWDLWRVLREVCIESGTGCDVLAIPHNSNISNGRMFAVDYPDAAGEDEQRARAALRISMEPIVEIMQHKGDSECRIDGSGLLGGCGRAVPLREVRGSALGEPQQRRRPGRLLGHLCGLDSPSRSGLPLAAKLCPPRAG